MPVTAVIYMFTLRVRWRHIIERKIPEEILFAYISYHKNNSIITIDGEDIKSVENNMIRYYSDNKTKKVSLNSSAKKEMLTRIL